jgi:BirA family biotin operon repressor/biotin-[acetyl-CoA-carboxylase] ligase
MSEPLPLELAAGLQRTRDRRGPIGEPTYYFAETASTNDVAGSLADRGAPEGTTIVAGCQTAGRGRLGRSWHSPPDAGLYVSVVIRSPRAFPLITLAGGVAVADGIRLATGLPVDIKWPNDVVVADERATARQRKVAGILAEASSDGAGVLHAVLGFGINVHPTAYPPEIADRATSLETELGRVLDRGGVLGETLAVLSMYLTELTSGTRDRLLARWRALAPSATGSRVRWGTGRDRLLGLTNGIDDEGALLVRVAGRTERVIAGEVTWLAWSAGGRTRLTTDD